MTRCLEKYEKQWRPTQEKLGWQKQKEEEAKEEAGRKREEQERKNKQKREKMIEVKKVAEEEEAVKLETKARKLVPEKFHK